MSSPSGPSQTAAPSSIFKSMLDAALAEYKKKTGEDLLAHWLAAELQSCETVHAVLDILRDQAKVFEQAGDQKLMKSIGPLVHVLYTISGALGDGVSLAFPPAKVIFTGIGVLLGAAKDAGASHGAIIDLFERLESFFKRLKVYTQTSLTTEMAEVLVKIVIELLSILSIATKEVKRTLPKLFSRRLLGKTDIEDALKRLDSLIQLEVQMAIAQTLKVATEAKDGADETGRVMQQMSNDVGVAMRDVEEVKWAQVERDIHKWFSPPDPSTNYNIGCETQSEGTAAWFFQETKFNYWMSSGSLLWIHGKPGSGKTILSSAIVKHFMSLRDAGEATLAYFYFDFRDKDKKQDFRHFVTSLLVQLSAYSSQCCEIISSLYSSHGKGTQQPSKGALTNCLREMLSVAAQQPIYIIVDALDECPNFSGLPTPREVVLNLLEDLVGLRLPNLHICVTSRPEADILRALEPLLHNAISLHDESGQMKDISDYVSGVVYSDKMWRLRDEEKELVVEELSKKANGMFRWVFCQLEVMQHCLPASIRQTLDQLPESLDETYVRVLSQIPQTNQAHAHRMLQCLLVALRPLRVEELAELLAFEFDAAEGGIPKYRASWRLDDQTQAVLSTCSSLVTIVNNDEYSRPVVQFSHFSVKEFLVSNRLGDFSRYHIRPAIAHTILTQACLGFLLHLDDHIDTKNIEDFPLAEYAAQHWVEHARFEDVASCVMDGMKTLFDPDKLHFAAWVGIYNMGDPYHPSLGWMPNPLYYSVLCGFYDLVKHLAIKKPQLVNAICGRYRFPLVAALSEDHFEIAGLLLEHGASVDIRRETGETILLKVLSRPRHNLANIVKFLLEHGADVNARDGALRSSLHLAEYRGELEVAQMLLEYKADVNTEDKSGKTPLHILSGGRWYIEDDVINHVRSLLEHGADVNRRDENNQTPLHLAMEGERFKLVRMFLEHDADASMPNNEGKTPLQILLKHTMPNEDDVLDHVRLLLEHGADANRRDENNQTPLHLAMGNEWFKLVRILLEHGADTSAQNKEGKTPLQILLKHTMHSEDDILNHARLLLEHRADVNRQDENNQTPLHLAMGKEWFKLVRMFLEHDADATMSNNEGKTPLQILLMHTIHNEDDVLNHARLLLEHGADANRRDEYNQTLLHLAMGKEWFKLVRILLEHGVDASAQDKEGKTPLQILLLKHTMHSEDDVLNLAQLLLEHGADANRRDENNRTPLHIAMWTGRFKLVPMLLEHGADASAQNKEGKTPFQVLSARLSECQICNKSGVCDVPNHTRLWWENGEEVNKRYNETPLLLEIDAYLPVENNMGETSVHQVVSRGQYGPRDRGVGVAQLSLERERSNTGVEDENHTTPSYLQSNFGKVQIPQALLDHGANVMAGNKEGAENLLLQGLEERGIDVNVQNMNQVQNHITPLHLASLYGRLDIARVLLDHGATVNWVDNFGRTPLHLVAEGTHNFEQVRIRVAQLLLECGSDVNAQDEDNATPLHLAARNGRVAIARVLLDGGAAANAKGNYGRTPLHSVAEGRYIYSKDDGIRVAKLLLERGADVNVQDEDNKTPLHLASYYGKVAIARVLLDCGAAANSKDSQGRTPLHSVAEDRYLYFKDDGIRVAQLLLERGADVNAPDEDDKTPLHLASYYGRVEMIPVLLNNGANSNAKNAHGQTPLHLVSQRPYYSEDDGVSVARLLLVYDADVNAQDVSHATPSDLASHHGRTEIASLLLKYCDKSKQK